MTGPRPLGWREAMSEAVLARCSASDVFRLEFVRAIGGLVYETIHTDCDPDCICHEPRGLHNGRGRNARRHPTQASHPRWVPHAPNLGGPDG